MGNYRAKRQNDEENKTQDEINSDNNANTIKNAADVAMATKIPHAVLAGAIVKGADKLTGGKSTKVLGKVANNAFKMAPNGQMMQNTSNMLSESGVGDAIGTAANIKNNGLKGLNNNTSNQENSFNVQDEKGSNSEQKSGMNLFNGLKSKTSKINPDDIVGSLWKNMPKSLKIKIVIGGVAVLFICLICFTVFASDDIKNLSLTDKAQISSKGHSASSTELLGKLEELANYFIENAGEYNQGGSLQVPMVNHEVRKDCSGFVSAYMSYVSGADLFDGWTGAGTSSMSDTGGAWSKAAQESGWKLYTVSEIGDPSNLKPGDVLVQHFGGTNGHTEIFIDSTHTFGWGSRQTHYPLDKTIVSTGSGTFGDGYHSNYTLVYRYENIVEGTGSTSGQESQSANGWYVLLNPSHQIKNSTTSSNSSYNTERNSMYTFVSQVKSELVAKGYGVYVTPDSGNIDDGDGCWDSSDGAGSSGQWAKCGSKQVSAAINKHNDSKTIYLALHSNASNGNEYGPAVYYSTKSSGSNKLGQSLCNGIGAVYTSSYKGKGKLHPCLHSDTISEPGYYYTNGGQGNAVLIEIGFHDNSDNQTFIENSGTLLAKGIVDGLESYKN